MAGTDQKAGSDGPNSGGGVVENKAHEHPQAPAAAASEAYVEEVHLNPLPPAPKSLAGSSHVKGQNYRVEVSNKSGYLCHLSLESTWDLPPEVLFSIFTYPDNSPIFRDIQRVGSREVLKTSPGFKQVKVEQVGELKILWIRRAYSTWLTVTEDSRDPECLVTIFELLRSDVLGRFNGRWDLHPVRDPASGKVVGCKGLLEQDVLPKGVPSFLAQLPVLGGLLRGAVCRTIQRLMEDINAAADKVRAGHAAGESTEAVLRRLCGPCAEEGFSNGAVTSFAFDVNDDEEDEDDDADGDAAAAGGAKHTVTGARAAAGGAGSKAGGVGKDESGGGARGKEEQVPPLVAVVLEVVAEPDDHVRLVLVLPHGA